MKLFSSVFKLDNLWSSSTDFNLVTHSTNATQWLSTYQFPGCQHSPVHLQHTNENGIATN